MQKREWTILSNLNVSPILRKRNIDGKRKRNIAILINPISGRKEAYNIYKTKLRPLLKVAKLTYKVFRKLLGILILSRNWLTRFCQEVGLEVKIQTKSIWWDWKWGWIWRPRNLSITVRIYWYSSNRRRWTLRPIFKCMLQASLLWNINQNSYLYSSWRNWECISLRSWWPRATKSLNEFYKRGNC